MINFMSREFGFLVLWSGRVMSNWSSSENALFLLNTPSLLLSIGQTNWDLTKMSNNLILLITVTHNPLCQQEFWHKI